MIAPNAMVRKLTGLGNSGGGVGGAIPTVPTITINDKVRTKATPGDIADLIIPGITGTSPLSLAFSVRMDGVEVSTTLPYTIQPADGGKALTILPTLAGVTLELTAPVTVTALPAELAVAHNGVTFNLSGVTAQGTHFDGTPWVVVPGGATLVGTQPASAQLDITYKTSSSDPTIITSLEWSHGLRKSPGRSPSGATLGEKQTANDFGGTGQGYGWKSPAKVAFLAYDHTLNVDPGATGAPLVLTPGVYCKAISFTDSADLSWDGRPALQTFGVLTVYASAPAANSFRTPFAGNGAAVGYTTADLDMSKLKNLSSVGYSDPVVTYENALNMLKQILTFEHTFAVNSENIVPLCGASGPSVNYSVSSYLGTTMKGLADLMNMLHYDTWTAAQKRIIAAHLTQKGIDAAERVKEGGIFYANGGHSFGRKFLIAFAAEMLNDAALRSVAGTLNVSSTYDGYTAGDSVFGEDMQTGYIRQVDITNSVGLAQAGRSVEFDQSQLGWPAWCDNFGNGFAKNTLGNVTTLNTYGAGYENIVSKALVPFALAARHLTGMKATMGAKSDALFEWTDRYAQAWLNGTTSAPGVFLTAGSAVFIAQGVNSMSLFAKSSWQATRSTLGVIWSYNPTPTVIGFMGQSNIEYIMASSVFYNSATPARPTITNENAIYVGQNPGSTTIVDRAVSDANVSGRTVNLAMAVWSKWLDYIAPGRQFVFLDISKAGKGRAELANDADIDYDWLTEFADIINYVVPLYGEPDHIIEFWYADDAGAAEEFLNEWSPFYLGQRANGTSFTVGTANPDSTRNPGKTFDHILWDVEAEPTAKGRGLFARAKTTWTFVRNHFKDNTFEREQGIQAFYDDPRVQEFATTVGTFGGLYANNGSHALIDDSDGQAYFAWAFAPAIANAIGITVGEPEAQSVTVAADGSYADVTVSLPNGGVLSTTRINEGRAAAASPQPYQQPVSGIEIRRNGTSVEARQPVYKLTETSYPADYRGTVTIQDAATGKIRVTPEVPFVNGDEIYVMWQGATSPVTPGTPPQGNTSKVWLDYPIVTAPALTDPTALYKFPGVPVRSFAPALIISGSSATPPAVGDPFFKTSASGPYFVDTVGIGTASAVTFASKFRLSSLGSTLAAKTSNGFDIDILSNGNLRITVEDSAGTKLVSLAVVTAGLVTGTWYDLVVSADHGTQKMQVVLNGPLIASVAFSAAGTGVFASTRSLSALTNSSGVGQTIGDFQWLRFWKSATAGGTAPVGTPYKAIEASAGLATVNADTWKLGANAT